MINKLKQIELVFEKTCNWLGVTVDEMCVECEHYNEDEGYCKAYTIDEAMEHIKEILQEGKI